MSLLWRMSGRELLHHRWQALLSLLGVALGVAVVVAVDLANESARRAFALSMESLTGQATHRIQAGGQGLDEGLYTQLALDPDLDVAAPTVEGVVTVQGLTLRLLGVAPFAENGVRGHLEGLEGEALTRLLTEPGAVALSVDTAASLNAAVDRPLAAQAAGRTIPLTPVALLAGDPGLDGLLLADIATAQEVLDKLGRLDRIDLVLEPGQAEELARRLPPGVRLEAAEERGDAALELANAFHLNLTAMSLLALVVGSFLIYNTLAFSVVRRRPRLATLRLVGVTPRGLFRLVLAEAALLGALGALLGLAAGWALGNALLGLVTRALNDHYFLVTVTGLTPATLSFAKGALLGLGVSLAAAWAPARQAAGASLLAARRRSADEGRARRLVQPLALWGLGLLALAPMLILLGPADHLVLGFAALLALILGASLLAPLAVQGLPNRLAGPLGRLFGPPGRLAARGLAASVSRSGMAVAALMVAVSATVGVGVMVESFRGTVDRWLGQTLRSDLYVSAPEGADALPPGVAERLDGVPGIRERSSGRRVEADTPRGPIDLLALGLASQSPRGFELKTGDPASAWPRVKAGEAVLISEPLAFHRGLGLGDELLLNTPAGPRRFPVAGIFYDYSAVRGMAVMERGRYRELWDDPAVSTYGLYLQPDADPDQVKQAVRGALAGHGEVLVQATGEIRARSLEIFDRTFAITHVLRLLVVGVAFIGVLSALLALQLERAREHAVLRATGLTPRGLFGLTALQTGLMGTLAGLLALPLGLAMAWLLIEVINRRSFGWSMDALIPPGTLAEALLLAIAAALLAGLYPAWRMGRAPIAAALREE